MSQSSTSAPNPDANVGADESMEHKARRRSSVHEKPGSLNLTSMIDVVFQLLIYFIVTASFAQGEGIIIAKLPQSGGQASAEAEPPKQPLKIVLTSTGMSAYRINLDGYPAAPADFEQLGDLLETLRHDPQQGLTGPYKDDNPIIIQPDGKTRWQHVVNAFNATVAARYKNVSFAAAKD